MSVLKCQNLSKRYGTHQAVSEVSFELIRGQVVGLLGLNGAGKTTTLSMLCGIIAPDQGSVEIAGHSLRTHPIDCKKNIGFLPDQLPLYKELTINEFLVYCALLRRVERAMVDEAVALAADRCGLSDRTNQLIGQLSRGYQQRVAIAQAIVHNPVLTVLDEPTSGLDPVQIHHIRELIRELGKERTVIISTHNLSEAEQLCGRVLIIHQGKIVLDKKTDELTDGASSVVVSFGKAPSVSELESVPSVVSVAELGNDRFRLNIKADTKKDAGYDQLLTRAVKDGWHLRELSQEQHSIESVFLDLTGKKQNGEAASA